MQIFRNLFIRVASGLASIGWSRPCATAILAFSAVSTLNVPVLSQSPGGRRIEALELPTVRGSAAPSERGGTVLGGRASTLPSGRTSARLAQAPMTGVPPLGSGPAYSSATEVPSVIGPPIMDSQPMYSAPYSTPSSAGYEIPCPEAGCDVSYYFSYEALYLRREGDDRLSLSRNNRLPNFDYEFGGRYTVGRLFDCVNGVEAVYVGPFDWSRQNIATGNGNLTSRFIPSGGYTGDEVSAFNNADLHSQLHQVSLDSFEVNRRWWAWDVLSTMIGVRSIDYREHYAFVSTRSGVGTGIFIEDTKNRLFGVQVGADMMYPLGLRTIVGARGKAGVFANFDQSTVVLQNAGTLVLDNRDRDVDVAGVIEYGVFGRYQIVPSIRLMAGYEFWYLPGVATVNGQSINRVNPDSGSKVDGEDEVFVHGGSVGVQVLF